MASKYFIFALIFLAYGIFSYNRKAVSYTIPVLTNNGMPSEQVGLILSAQNMAYAISKFIGGVASDRTSSKSLLSFGLAASGGAAFCFALSGSLPLYVLSWFANGLAQGLGWPAIAKLLRKWFLPVELGLWWSAASASANLSGVFGPVLAASLILALGWRESILVAGAMSVAAAALVYFFIQDEPSTNTAKKTKAEQKKPTIPFKTAVSILLRRPTVWVISLAYLSVSCVKTGLSDWSQTYITNDLNMPSSVAVSFLSSFEFGGFWGGIVAGYLSDYMMRKISIRNPRLVVSIFFALITGIALHIFIYYPEENTIQYVAAALGTSIFGQIALFGIAATESVVSEMSGTSHAIAALAANIGSVLAGLPFAALARNHSWYAVFQILMLMNTSSVVMLISTIVLRFQ